MGVLRFSVKTFQQKKLLLSYTNDEINSGNTTGILHSLFYEKYVPPLFKGYSQLARNSFHEIRRLLVQQQRGKEIPLYKNCRGLSNCDHKIIKVNLKKAQDLGKELCGWED